MEWAVLGIAPVRRVEVGTEWITQAKPGSNAPPIRQDATLHVAAAAFDPTGRRLALIELWGDSDCTTPTRAERSQASKSRLLLP